MSGNRSRSTRSGGVASNTTAATLAESPNYQKEVLLPKSIYVHWNLKPLSTSVAENLVDNMRERVLEIQVAMQTHRAAIARSSTPEEMKTALENAVPTIYHHLIDSIMNISMEIKALAPRPESEWNHTLWWSTVYTSPGSLGDDQWRISRTIDADWGVNLQTMTLQFRADHLNRRPKPDFAFGIAFDADPEQPASLNIHDDNIFEKEVLSALLLEQLETDSRTNLHPRPASAANSFAYPFCVHESKTLSRSPQFAVNQLARSITFALEQQEELRIVAREARQNQQPGTGIRDDDDDERQPIFGITSVGSMVQIYICQMHPPTTDKIRMCLFATFFIEEPSDCLCFLVVLQLIKSWALRDYKVFIEGLLRRATDILRRPQHPITPGIAG